MRHDLLIDTSGADWSHFHHQSAARTGDVRIYAIGDIHGYIDQLRAMQEAIAADLERHPVERSLVVYLGDYIDRGPDARAVLDAIIAHRAASAPHARVICLTGNHEAWLNQFLTDAGVLPLWARKGGLETLASYDFPPERVLQAMADPAAAEALRRDFLQRLPETHRQLLASLEFSHVEGDYFFVHGGIDPDRPLADQDRHDLIWIRDKFLFSLADFGKVVVHGHTPSPEVESLPNRINVDTGIYATRMLSCVILEGAQRHLIAVKGRTMRPAVLTGASQ